MLAPIVLFTFNRPWHTQQTLDALAKNEEAKNSLLIIYCDGAKKDAKADEVEKIEQVRLIAKNENRFKSVSLIVQKSNKGLANSIIDGVTEVVNKYGKVIVLEDDLVTSPLFLKFMNRALNYYSEKNQVACITGYVYPLKNVNNNEAFFIKGADCWSWATWKNKWNEVFCNDA
jgi:GT2 family glycosyltransferase